MPAFTESGIEIFSLGELKELGRSHIPGPSIAPDGEAPLGMVAAEPAPAYVAPGKRGLTVATVVVANRKDDK